MRSFMIFRTVLLGSLIVLASSARSAIAGIIPIGSPVPVIDGLSLIYDPDNGNLMVQAPQGKPLTAIEIRSAGSRFSGTCQNLTSPFDVCSAPKLFKLGTNGFDAVDLGPVLPAHLTPENLVTDFQVDGATLGGGFQYGSGVFAVHPQFVPEPSTGLALLLSGLVTLMVRRSYR